MHRETWLQVAFIQEGLGIAPGYSAAHAKPDNNVCSKLPANHPRGSTPAVSPPHQLGSKAQKLLTAVGCY